MVYLGEGKHLNMISAMNILIYFLAILLESITKHYFYACTTMTLSSSGTILSQNVISPQGLKFETNNDPLKCLF